MLYIMRHGRTDWNEVYRLQGRTDIPLNESGREMARQAAEEYKDVHLDICFCSPLIRAKETAQLFLAGREIPIVYDERLIEMSFGDYEGCVECMGHPENPIYPLFTDPAHYIAPESAETLEELFARTSEFMEERVHPLLAKGLDVVIVGHGAMNSSIICRHRGLSNEHLWDEGIPNCKLIKLQ